MARVYVSLLGGFQARLESGSPVALPTRKAQALIAYLALPAGQAHPRDKLAALLWGGIREESARASLRQGLFSLRKALGDEAQTVLRQEGDTLALDAGAVDIDVTSFEQAVKDATPMTLARAAELYCGDLLAGLVIDEAPFEEWLLGERERLRELALEGLAKLLRQQRDTGATEAAVGTALRLLTLDPLQEPVHQTLMRLYAELGRRGAALRQYQHCVAALQRELGVEPELETKLLYQELLRLRSKRLPADATVQRREPSSTFEHRAPGASADAALVGRAIEMERLQAALAGATAGGGRVVAVLGEAGIGKSRLVGELVVEAARCGVTVLVGRAYESEQILPFGPWVDALRAGRLTDDADLLERLGPALRSELARLLPDVGGGAAPPGGTADVGLIFESVTRLIEHLAGRQPVLLVLEDLHWADELSARLVAFIGRRLARRPVTLLLTAREDELADAPALRQALDDLERGGSLVTLALRPLSRLDTLTLVRTVARVGDEATTTGLGEQAWAASEGNPFVVVEVVRADADGARVVHGRGLTLPARVREIIGRRLDRLSERGQSLVAVIGREFEFALVQRAAGLGEEDAAGGVEELVRRRVLHGLGERFDFTHDRIRDVAYGRILAPRHKLLHRKVAEAIEVMHASDLDAHALALGRHYREAEMWEPAVGHLRKAGIGARVHGANREAITCLESVLAAVDRLADGPTKAGHAVDVRVDLELALMGLGQFRQGFQRLSEAEALAVAAGDRRRLGRVYSRMTYELASLGDFSAALAKGAAVLALATEQQDVVSMSSSYRLISRALYGLGEYRQAIEVAQRNDDLVRAVDPQIVARDRQLSPARNLAFSRGGPCSRWPRSGSFAKGQPLGRERFESPSRSSDRTCRSPCDWASDGSTSSRAHGSARSRCSNPDCRSARPAAISRWNSRSQHPRCARPMRAWGASRRA